MRRTKAYDMDYMTGQEDIDDTLREIKEEFSPQWGTNGPETKNGIVAGSLLVKLRKEPSFESDVMDLLRSGEKVTILEKGNKFYKVMTESNREGYISLDYIKEE